MGILTLGIKSAVVAEGLRCESIFGIRFVRKLVEPLAYKNLMIPAGVSLHRHAWLS